MDHGIEVLKGKTLTNVIVDREGDEKITFYTTDGDVYIMQHHQDCCESVVIDDINGDLTMLIGSEILTASERVRVSGDDDDDGYQESNTWTFYYISTLHETVSIKWWGSSNGYYSESVSFDKVD